MAACRTALHIVPSTSNIARHYGKIPGASECFNLIGVLIKSSKLIATLLIASSASLAVSAFASGYGPAPYYRPEAGAPASQRGQSAQTMAMEEGQASMAADNGGGVGGDQMPASQSGKRMMADSVDMMYRGN